MPKRSSPIQKDLRAIGKAFKSLAHHFEKIAPQLGEQAKGYVSDLATEMRSRLKPQLTAATRATLKLQGKYMGTMRRLNRQQRAAVKKLRVEKGISAAIAEAKRLAAYLKEAPKQSEKGKGPRRKRRVSANHRAAMRLHGQYLGAIRRLEPLQRAKVKKIREAKGVRAAIAAAKRIT